MQRSSALNIVNTIFARFAIHSTSTIHQQSIIREIENNALYCHGAS